MTHQSTWLLVINYLCWYHILVHVSFRLQCNEESVNHISLCYSAVVPSLQSQHSSAILENTLSYSFRTLFRSSSLFPLSFLPCDTTDVAFSSRSLIHIFTYPCNWYTICTYSMQSFSEFYAFSITNRLLPPDYSLSPYICENSAYFQSIHQNEERRHNQVQWSIYDYAHQFITVVV